MTGLTQLKSDRSMSVKSTEENVSDMSKKRRALPKRDFTLEDFCTRSTSHGLADLYEAQSTLAQCWWAFLIIMSVGVLFYGIFQEIYEYYTGPIQSSISFIPSSELQFPQIYICPMSFVNRDCVQNWTEFHNKTAVFKKRSGSLLDQTGSNWKTMAAKIRDVDYDMFVTQPKAGTNPAPPDSHEPVICGPRNQGYLKHVAMAIPDIFIDCKFSSESVLCDCLADTYIDKEYGICYLFDVSKVNRGMQTTENIGLSIILDVHSEYFPPNEEDQSLFNGAVVRVGNPVDHSGFGGIVVQTGTYNKIALEAEQRKLIDIEYSKTPQHCVEEGEHVMQFFGNVTYSAGVCRMDCIQTAVYQKCNCVMPLDNRIINEIYSKANICNNVDFETCVQPAIERNSQIQAQIHECTKTCYIACQQWKYRTTLSSFLLPPNTVTVRSIDEIKSASCPRKNESFSIVYKDGPLNDKNTDAIFEQNATYETHGENETNADYMWHSQHEDGNQSAMIPEKFRPPPPADRSKGSASEETRTWKNNYIVLDIAFEQLQYTQVTQSPPRTISTLVSNIGGQAGLWTGASIFTIVQVIVFATYLIYSKLGKKKA